MRHYIANPKFLGHNSSFRLNVDFPLLDLSPTDADAAQDQDVFMGNAEADIPAAGISLGSAGHQSKEADVSLRRPIDELGKMKGDFGEPSPKKRKGVSFAA